MMKRRNKSFSPPVVYFYLLGLREGRGGSVCCFLLDLAGYYLYTFVLIYFLQANYNYFRVQICQNQFQIS